ncbi:transposase [Streptomyces sp. NPDC005151]
MSSGRAGAVVAGGGGGPPVPESTAVDRRCAVASADGVPWRGLPCGYGPWQTVYELFRRRQREGVWARVLTALQTRADASGLITWELNVDSTVCRAHQHAAGARRDGAGQKEPPGGVRAEPDDHGLGRSRGGFSTKIHPLIFAGNPGVYAGSECDPWGGGAERRSALRRCQWGPLC